METPNIEVGILSAENIRICLNGMFRIQSTGQVLEGEGMVAVSPGNKIILTVGEITVNADFPVLFEPEQPDASSFDLYDVVIGIRFHWERKETQRFKGALKLMLSGDQIIAVNILSIEDYLTSVISSEMSATSSFELLKAHAVISRSWLLAQQEKKKSLEGDYQTISESPDEYIRWYDREDHDLFDVCADDHCQRYQGITKVSTPIVEKAIAATRGKVLLYNGKICDARFSKCCGGVTEDFVNVWEPVKHPYLTRVIDNPHVPKGFKLDLHKEQNAEKWILSTPEAFCNTRDHQVLSSVLNDYDQETQHFFRWKEALTQEKLQRLLLVNTGYDFGEIIDLLPVERGVSGRLIRLKIVGSKKIMTIGKELYIRKVLSDTHLYSSAFVVEKEYTQSDLPERFILLGAGWGHGVGLCQIGAAVMGAKGFSYEEILGHYFPGAELRKMFD